MWLINTTTLELHDFVDHHSAPPYAILSHCWGEGEVSFKDFRKKRDCAGPGLEKIVGACEHTRQFKWWARGDDNEIIAREGLDWLWVDTW